MTYSGNKLARIVYVQINCACSALRCCGVKVATLHLLKSIHCFLVRYAFFGGYKLEKLRERHS